jgi:hypothetical protein
VSILRSGRHISSPAGKAVEMCFDSTPAVHPFDRLRTGLVSGPDDPSIGGGRLGAMTPFTRSGYIT